MKLLYSSLLLIILISCVKTDKKDILSVGDQYYNNGEQLYASQKYDSAFIYFNKAHQSYSLLDKNKESANALVYQSIIQTIKGDYFGSEESAIEALKKLDSNNSSNNDLLVSIYNQIALNKEYQKDYTAAVNWYQLAVKKTSNHYDSIVLQNNIAVSYYEDKKYDNAIDILASLQSLKNDSIINARILDNLAYAKFLKDSNYNAEQELKKALQLKQETKDLWGQNASYAHLADFFHKKDPSKSLFYAKKMLEVSTQLNSADDKLSALQKIVLLESTDNSKAYFINYQKLNDSIQLSKSNAKNQFALIRYETEKQKAENTAKQNQILKQYFILCLLAGIIIFIIFWNQRRKNSLRKEKEIEVKKTQLKYSKKVHDVVANGLYHTMVEIQNTTTLDKERILNNIEKMYEESRDIARDDLGDAPRKEFSVQLFEMLNSYSSDLQKVLIVGNEPKKWQNISPHIKTEILYILRELMINMKKHSQAKLVSIKINKDEKTLFVQYTDNGIGINDWTSVTTSGIKNMENRIVAMRGGINFDKNTNRGLIIHITVPII